METKISEFRHAHVLELYSYLLDNFADLTTKAMNKLNISYESIDKESIFQYTETQPVLNFHKTQRKVAQVIKVLETVLPTVKHKPKELLKLMRTAGFIGSASQAPRKMSEMSVSHPLDLIQTGFDREQIKHDRLLKVMDNIDNIKIEEEKWKSKIMKDFHDTRKRVYDSKAKKNEKLAEMIVENNEERKKHLDAKNKLIKKIEHEIMEHGKVLEEKLKKLDHQTQLYLREKAIRDQQNIKDWIEMGFRKQEINEKTIREEEEKSEVMLQELIKKLNARVAKAEANVQVKAQNARDHIYKVDETLAASKANDELKTQKSMAKFFKKSEEIRAKSEKKQQKFQDRSDKTKKMLHRSFERHDHCLSEVNATLLKKKKDTEKRVNRVDKGRHIAQSLLSKTRKKKSIYNTQRAADHARCYSNTLEEQRRFKEQIIEKHRKISQLIECMNDRRSSLSDKKRRRNFEVQKLRNEKRRPSAVSIL